MKDDLPYFSHDNDARSHAKMKALRARFGWAGYGRFWALNEMVAGSSYARLDLSRKVVMGSVACELGMTTDELEAFIVFLSDEEECGLVHYEDGVVTTDRTQENFGHINYDRERKRAQGKSGAEKHWNGAEKPESGAEKNTKLNKTKLKEKKENNSVSFDTFWEAYPRKVAKEQARRKYGAVLKGGTSEETILERLSVYKESIRRQGTETQFIRHPATFLGALDDYVQPEAKAVTAEKEIETVVVTDEFRALVARSKPQFPMEGRLPTIDEVISAWQ